MKTTTTATCSTTSLIMGVDSLWKVRHSFVGFGCWLNCVCLAAAGTSGGEPSVYWIDHIAVRNEVRCICTRSWCQVGLFWSWCVGTADISRSIWLGQCCTVFHYSHHNTGENPEMRTLFYRLCRLFRQNTLVIFVFDGMQRAECKRGKSVKKTPHWLEAAFIEMVELFGFTIHRVMNHSLYYHIHVLIVRVSAGTSRSRGWVGVPQPLERHQWCFGQWCRHISIHAFTVIQK